MCENKSHKQSLWWGLFSVLGALALALFLGCAGGGTAGSDTAGRSVGISGTVSDPQGAPREGVEVTLLETGDASTTELDGRFALEAQYEDPTATLEFVDEGFSAQLTIPDLPDSSLDVTVDVVADNATNTVEAERVEVNQRTPTPTPGAEEPTPGPSPEPTVVPTSAPTQGGGERTPTPTPIGERPTSRPTETPRPTDTPRVPDPTRTPEATPTATPIPSRWVVEGRATEGLEPLEGARVSIQETGASAVTARDGTFSFSTSIPGPSAIVEVSQGGASGRAGVGGLPERTARITLSIRVARREGNDLSLDVRVVSIE